MQNIPLKELQLATNPDFTVLFIRIRCLLTPEEVSRQESGGIFLGKEL
jgi:hypothetical protein